MYLRYLVAGLFGVCQTPGLAVFLPAFAEEKAVANPAGAAKPAPNDRLPVSADPLANAADTTASDKIVAIIRSKLADPSLRKGAAADDLAALEAFYAARTNGPLWTTEMGFTARAQEALFEIEKAADWGLDPAAFELPGAGALPKTQQAQASSEIKLNLGILKYARFARGGRLDPLKVSELYDQAPPLRDPDELLAAIETAASPAAYLQSLHPKHEQFVRLRAALLNARGKDETGDKAGANDKAKAKAEAKKKIKPQDSARDIKRLVLNMERWRWLPEHLGSLYIWSNSPEFMLHVVKDGKTIYSDKTLIGTINYATPVFTADMQTIVFNPDWYAPETVLIENVLPALRDKNYAVLKTHMLKVSHRGKPVDATKVKWSRGNILKYTFTQKAGPRNVLGKAKFLYPNKHVVYMHDTLLARKNVFKKPVRMIGHECVRMERPEKFATLLLAESNGMSAAEVKTLWDKSVNKPVTLTRKFPVHTTYFTAVVDETGKVSTFNDVYGLDRKLAAALFGDAKGFPQPSAEPKKPSTEPAAEPARTASGSSISRALQSLLGD